MKQHATILIIGCGIAALQTAKHLQHVAHVHIFAKGTLQETSSYRAQGGIAAAIAPDDTVQLHIDDTLQAGLHHQQHAAVERLVIDGKDIMKQLIEDGLPIDTLHGQPLFGLEGAHSTKRIVHAGGDATGRITTQFLYAQCTQVQFHFNEMVTNLLLNDARECIGIQTEHEDYYADYVVLATGGAGDLYRFTSNCDGAVGDGLALAYQSGAVLTDMEFIQFHPTLLYEQGRASSLVSEALRGAGATLINDKGERIVDWHPLKELAPRHITAHAIHEQYAQGRTVFLDATAIHHVTQRFPTVAQNCAQTGIDIATMPIPVVPGSHFLMGGVVTNDVGETAVPRLFAVGEVAWTGVHGANRLASNSLLECITFGKRCATYLAANAQLQTNWSVVTPTRNQVELLPKEQLQQLMMQHAGILRHADGLHTLRATLPTYAALYHATANDKALLAMHITAALVVDAAATRDETRGAHIRTDYGAGKDFWQHRYIMYQNGQKEVRLIHESTKTKTYA